MDLYDQLLSSATAQRLQRARVRAVPAQHSWAALPGPLVTKLQDQQDMIEPPVVLKLTPVPPGAASSSASAGRNSSFSSGGSASSASLRPRYVAWHGGHSSSAGWLELPAQLCAALQLPTGTEVFLEVLHNLAAAAAVVVEPVGPADWEVVELNAGQLEGEVLQQAGVAVLGQPFVVWARQAKVTFRVTGIVHSPTAGAADGRPGGGRQLVLKNVARMVPGTELHIAPKPRIVGSAGPGGSLVPGKVPLGQPNAADGADDGNSARSNAAAAASNAAQQTQQHLHEQQQQQQQQQQQPQKQQVKPVWLRVCQASADHLVSAAGLPATPTTAAAADAGDSIAQGVTSWITMAVHISSDTAHDLDLSPGGLMRLCGTSSSSSSSSNKGQSILPLQSLVVAVLLEDGVPWGHVSLTPPLQQGLGLRPHQFVQLRPLQRQQQLQQLPGFLLHPLLPAAGSTAASGAASQAAAAAAASAAEALTVAAGAAVGADGSVSAAAPPAAKHAARTGLLAGQQQQQQQQQQQHHHHHQHKQQSRRAQGNDDGDRFTGPGLLLDTVKGLVTMPLQVLRLQSSIQQAAQQQQQQQQIPAPAAEQQSPLQQQQQQRGHLVGSLPHELMLQPGVVDAAMLAWLKLQATAVLAAAAAAQGNGADEASVVTSAPSTNGPAAGLPTARAPAAAAAFPLSGPLLVHFRVNKGQAGAQEQQQQQPASTADFLLLLVPVSSGQQSGGSAGAAAAGAYLPAHLLLQQGDGSSKAVSTGGLQGLGQQQQQQHQQQLTAVKVTTAGALMYDAPAAGLSAALLSPAAQQHSQHLTCITYDDQLHADACASPQPPLSNAHNKHQQQQHTGWVEASEYPWLNPALQTCLERLKPRLDLLTWQSWQSVELPLPGGVLLVGGSEGGRSWLLQLMGQEAARQHGVHVLKVSCKSLAGQSYEAAAAVLACAAAEALACCPGLLLLDDLDLLTPAPNTEGPTGLEQDQATATRLAELLSSLLQWVARQPRPLTICAAVSAAAALPASLRAAGCLDCEVKVPALGQQGRAALLLAGFKDKGLGFSGGLQGLEALAGKGLEGFGAKDLQLVVDRAVHSALQRHMNTAAAGKAAAAATAPSVAAACHSNGEAGSGSAEQQQQELLVAADDIEQALSGFVAAAFWRAGQQKGGGQQGAADGGLQGWQDVGGLSEAVSALKEALVLPAQYGHLLAAAPLRLRTGLLLFGPPGCGKTHVVAAAVAATDARLISVKGPELLNKYIGQSEAAVRELFTRAAAAAPCVLFFDEFDAIAPPRGHDSTGVTDRVVNQLLTELDGVEGLTGVAVLAATSRPDLIDAALLRPGRLDRMVYCGFPNEADRLAILQAVSRKLTLADDISLSTIASMTQGFTGADLAAILSEAQLLAVHDQIDAQQPQADGGGAGSQSVAAGAGVAGSTGGGVDDGDGVVCRLTAQHLQRALSRARPSLPATEKQRLEAVYARFQQSRDPGLSNRPAVPDTPEDPRLRIKHATLA